MSETLVTPKFAVWSPPGHAIRIEYSSLVLDQIREVSVEGYHSVPHGGVETGGVLYGTHEENLVRITAWRPIACEYAKGPSFVLSATDEAHLTQALRSYGDDPDLAGTEPVGWYRAHTRSEVMLSDVDLVFYQHFFSQPWQIGLIVRPASFGPTFAGFFFREPDGAIHAESSYDDFVLKPLPVAQVAMEREPLPASTDAARANGAPVEAETMAPPTQAERPAGSSREPIWPAAGPERTGASWRFYAVLALVFVAAAAVGYWLLRPPDRHLWLAATDTGGQLRIAWDRAAWPVTHGSGGLIDIDDHGLRTQVKLSPADLNSGSIFYARQSGDVVVHLMVYLPGSTPASEMTRFLRPAPAAVPPPSPERQAEAGPPPAAPASAQHEPVEKLPAVDRTKAKTKPQTDQSSLEAKSPRHTIPFGPPPPPGRRPATNVATVAPPNIAGAPASSASGTLPSTVGAGSAPLPATNASSQSTPVTSNPSSTAGAPAGTQTVTPLPTPVTSQPAPVAPSRPKPPPAPASGRIIWTGRLAKNGRLVLTGNHASSGSISGALPAATARVSAFPADLTSQGITLFTADPRFAKPVTEAAGADNGWNATTYTWDTKRAAGIRVLEQPNAQNGYKLVLVSQSSKVSVVVLEWHTAQ